MYSFMFAFFAPSLSRNPIPTRGLCTFGDAPTRAIGVLVIRVLSAPLLRSGLH